MLIQKKRIHSVDIYLKHLSQYEKFRVLVHITPENSKKALKAGFSTLLNDGETLLPSIVGNISLYNANGRFTPIKELPKENRYLYTREWTRNQWCGKGETEEVTDYVDQYRMCYQRSFDPPPSVELAWVNSDSKNYVSTEILDFSKTSPEQIKHVINLFLELFGECELSHEDFSSLTTNNTKRINWKFFPIGNRPWETLKPHVSQIIKHKNKSQSVVMMDRQDYITSFHPDEIYVGQGGFNDYLAYIFNNHNIVVLESVMTDNATYVFGNNWQDVSKLTKAHIISGNLHKDRLIHFKGWKGKVANLFENNLVEK